MKNFDFPDELELAVTCASGLERALKSELLRLGYGDAPALSGEISFKGTISDVPKLNIMLRTADRVYIKLARFTAVTFDELFEGVKALPWERWIGRDDAFPVTGHSVRSELKSIPDCQKIVKKAVVERLKNDTKKHLYR